MDASKHEDRAIYVNRKVGESLIAPDGTTIRIVSVRGGNVRFCITGNVANIDLITGQLLTQQPKTA